MSVTACRSWKTTTALKNLKLEVELGISTRALGYREAERLPELRPRVTMFSSPKLCIECGRPASTSVPPTASPSPPMEPKSDLRGPLDRPGA